jgi:hypothetical protein
MPRFEKFGSPAGFDGSKDLQVVSVGKRTELRLSDEDGETDLVAWAEDDDILEVKNILDSKKARLKVSLRGKAIGRTRLRVYRRGLVLGEPSMTVSVVSDPNARQVGKTTGEAGTEMKRELQSLSLREAVLRIAEDQLHSALCTESNGFGVYSGAGQESYDWCGLFAYWCWRQAAAIKGVANPFGESSEVLASVQKAIHWAMQPDTRGQLLRYEGPSPMTGKGMQEFVQIGTNGYDLDPGDIMLLRKGTANGWKHISMIYSKGITDIDTIDGNQGAGQCIKIRRNLSIDELLADRSYTRVFIHVLV